MGYTFMSDEFKSWVDDPRHGDLGPDILEGVDCDWVRKFLFEEEEFVDSYTENDGGWYMPLYSLLNIKDLDNFDREGDMGGEVSDEVRAELDIRVQFIRQILNRTLLDFIHGLASPDRHPYRPNPIAFFDRLALHRALVRTALALEKGWPDELDGRAREYVNNPALLGERDPVQPPRW